MRSGVFRRNFFKPLVSIAADLDVSPNTLRKHMDLDPALALAYAKGRAARAGWVQEKIDAAIEKDPLRAQLLLMGMANQNPEQGGLGWVAPGQQIRLEGTIEIKTSPAQLAWNEVTQKEEKELKGIEVKEIERKEIKVTGGEVELVEGGGGWTAKQETGTEEREA